MKQTVVIFLLTALMFAGCSTNTPVDNSATAPASVGKMSELESVYQYTGYSRAGVVVVRGTITLSVSTVGRVVGRWELRGDPTVVGPQVGRGTLMGTLVNGVLSVNLNPTTATNTVQLTGRFSRTEYAGRWEWITSRGVANAGTFRAARATTAATVAAD